MGEERFHGISSFQLCIDNCDAGCCGGTVYSRGLPSPVPFNDLGELLPRLDAAMDRGNFPQAFMRLRAFRGRERDTDWGKEWKNDGAETHSGKLATFSVKIRTRRYADWQGAVVCPTGEIHTFSGVLDLIQVVEKETLRIQNEIFV